MILALVLAVAMQAAPVAEETDIVVIGRRLDQIQAIIGRDARGRYTCGLTQSSGRLSLDAQLCRTATTCVRKGATDGAAVRACVDRRKPELLADLKRTMAK